MEKCKTGQPGYRPNAPSHMSRSVQQMNCQKSMPRPQASCGCDHTMRNDMYDGLDSLPLAMAYVPFQKFRTTFDLTKALQVGTIFPELCKPFCGKRGNCR